MGNATLFRISILQDLSNGIIKIPIWTSFNPSNLVSKLWDSKFSKVRMHLGILGTTSHTPTHFLLTKEMHLEQISALV
jgi:hypothetical protein